MISLEFLIVIALALGATFFVIVVGIGLVINKWAELRRTSGEERLYKYYSGMMADLLLQPLREPTDTNTVVQQYESILDPVKSGLSWSTRARKNLHRAAIRNVLIDFSRDLTGESLDRLQFFFGSLGFVDEEVELLGRKQWWVRAQAARNLGLLRAHKSIPVLTAALKDDHEDVRNQAMQSLVVLAGVEALQTIFKTTRGLSRWTTLELSVIVRQFEDRSIPYLIEALQYSDQSVVLFSIEMLAEIGFVSAVDSLVEMANSYPNVVIRSHAIEALGRLGDERSEPLLHTLLVNPYPAIRSSAVRALERIGSPGSIDQLKVRITEGDVQERISAARALAKSGEAGLEQLRLFVHHPDSIAQGVALHVLEEAEGLQTLS